MRIGNILRKTHFKNAPRRFLSLSSEMKSIKQDLQKKGANEGKLFFYGLLFPGSVGATIGSYYGFIDGYNSSKKKDFYYNCFMSMGGFVTGFFMGSYYGFLWPFSITVGIMRFYEEQFKPYNEKTNKSDKSNLQ